MLVAPGASAQRWKHCRAFSSRISTQRSPLKEHPYEGEQVFHFPMLSSCRQWSIEAPGPSLPTTGSGAGSAYPVARLFWTTTRGTEHHPAVFVDLSFCHCEGRSPVAISLAESLSLDPIQGL